MRARKRPSAALPRPGRLRMWPRNSAIASWLARSSSKASRDHAGALQERGLPALAGRCTRAKRVGEAGKAVAFAPGGVLPLRQIGHALEAASIALCRLSV